MKTQEQRSTKRIISAIRLWRERGDEFVFYADFTVGVPSRSEAGVIHTVDTTELTCSCPDSALGGHMCAHTYAALIARTKGMPKGAPELRRAEAKIACNGCGTRHPRRDLTELRDGMHDNLTFFDGDLLCPACRDECGVIW